VRIKKLSKCLFLAARVALSFTMV